MKEYSLKNLPADIECAVSHLVSFSSDDNDIEEKRETLHEEFKNKLKLKNFSLAQLSETRRKHNDTFSVEEKYYQEAADYEKISLDDFYNRIRQYPAIILSYNDEYFVLDGQHRVNELITLKCEDSSHMVIKMEDLPSWTLQLLKDSYF